MVESLVSAGLLQEDEKGRKVVEGEDMFWIKGLEKFHGFCLLIKISFFIVPHWVGGDGSLVTIVKSDGSTLYITRDLAAAIDRRERFQNDLSGRQKSPSLFQVSD